VLEFFCSLLHTIQTKISPSNSIKQWHVVLRFIYVIYPAVGSMATDDKPIAFWLTEFGHCGLHLIVTTPPHIFRPIRSPPCHNIRSARLKAAQGLSPRCLTLSASPKLHWSRAEPSDIFYAMDNRWRQKSSWLFAFPSGDFFFNHPQ